MFFQFQKPSVERMAVSVFATLMIAVVGGAFVLVPLVEQDELEHQVGLLADQVNPYYLAVAQEVSRETVRLSAPYLHPQLREWYTGRLDHFPIDTIGRVVSQHDDRLPWADSFDRVPHTMIVDLRNWAKGQCEERMGKGYTVDSCERTLEQETPIALIQAGALELDALYSLVEDLQPGAKRHPSNIDKYVLAIRFYAEHVTRMHDVLQALRAREVTSSVHTAIAASVDRTSP